MHTTLTTLGLNFLELGCKSLFSLKRSPKQRLVDPKLTDYRSKDHITSQQIITQQIIGQHIIGQHIISQHIIGQQIIGQKIIGQQIIGQQVISQHIMDQSCIEWVISFPVTLELKCPQLTKQTIPLCYVTVKQRAPLVIIVFTCHKTLMSKILVPQCSQPHILNIHLGSA